MKKVVVGVVVGLILGSAGTSIASRAVSGWHQSGPGYVCQNEVAANQDFGPSCDTTARDWAGGRLQVFVTSSGVGIAYDQAKRSGTIYFCTKGQVPIGYHPTVPGQHHAYWDGCH